MEVSSEDAHTWDFRAGEDLLYLASSLKRNAQTLAASSGWPILDSGTRLNTSNFPDSTPPKPATIGVLNIPLFLCQPVWNRWDISQKVEQWHSVKSQEDRKVPFQALTTK